MERDSSVEVDTDAKRVKGHTFERGYELHDVAEAHITQFLQNMGLTVKSWGINRREDNHVQGDDKMDLRLQDEDDHLLGQLEVKTKSNAEWFGVVNRDHFGHYLQWAHERDVPTHIYMSLLNDDEDSIVRDTFIPVKRWDEYERQRNGAFDFYPKDEEWSFLMDQLGSHPQVEREFAAPDGGRVLKLDVNTGVTWPTYTAHLLDTEVEV